MCECGVYWVGVNGCCMFSCCALMLVFVLCGSFVSMYLVCGDGRHVFCVVMWGV